MRQAAKVWQKQGVASEKNKPSSRSTVSKFQGSVVSKFQGSVVSRFDAPMMEESVMTPAEEEVGEEGVGEDSNVPQDLFQTKAELKAAMNSLCTRYTMDQKLPTGFQSLAVLKEGESFGEQSFLNDEQLSLSSVITLDYCELMKLKRSDFEVVCECYPELQMHVEGYKREMYQRCALSPLLGV